MDTLYKISSKYIFPSDPAAGSLGSLDLNIYIIQWAGVPLLGAKKESLRFKILIVVYGIVAISLATFIYTGLEVYDLILSWGNLKDLTQNCCLSMTHVAGVLKVIYTFYKRKDILRIIEQMRFLAKKYVSSERQIEAFYRGEFENKIPLTIYAGIVIFTGIMAMIMVWLDPVNIAGKAFPFRVKMPEFIPYGLQIVYMSVAIIVCAMQVVGIDYLNITMINQTRYQLKFLNIAFDSLAVTDDNHMEDPNAYLNGLVEHHNDILRVRDEIESIFKFPLLLQFFASLVIFALTGFQATVQSDSSGIVMIYFYFGGIFCELFVYCWFGNEVSEQNKTLASRGYNSSWYTFDHRYKKSLLIFLVNAQRPLTFTAGGFFDLSLTTFTGILSKSYTYIAVLRQLYAE